MPRPDRKRTPKTWQARELAGLQKELKGAKRWIVTLKTVLSTSPDDRWAQGMLRHYEKRVVDVSDRIMTLQAE